MMYYCINLLCAEFYILEYNLKKKIAFSDYMASTFRLQNVTPNNCFGLIFEE